MASDDEKHEGVTAAVTKKAGPMVYLQEELTDARLRCDQLKKFLDKAVRLISESSHRDHFYEVAGDIIYGIPDVVFRLDKALDATALAASRLDYEELKQGLKPEKVEELENVLKDVRIRHIDRRSPNIQPRNPFAPPGKQAMFKLASTNLVSSTLRKLADYIDHDPKPNRHVIIGALHRIKMGLSQTAQEAIQAMGPLQANSREEVMKGFKEANPDLTEAQLNEIADQWEKNKDVVKDKQAAGADFGKLQHQMQADLDTFEMAWGRYNKDPVANKHKLDDAMKYMKDLRDLADVLIRNMTQLKDKNK